MGQTIKVKKHDRGIGHHLESVNVWEGYMGKISNGEMSVLVDGTWLPEKEFNDKYPKPFVMDFLGDATNPDGSKNWMNK